MKLRAMAKINLGLDVIGKRPDGYHDVRMIMQTINMYDTLELTREAAPGIRLTSNLPYVPTDERNLAVRAAALLMNEFGITDGLSVDLQKFIPVAAGMAGGSSDAAAALVGVNRMFRLGLSTQELMDRGVKIGADVPYCILRGTALAEGIGEKLTVLPPVPYCYVLIGKPAVSVSTKTAYEKLVLDGNTVHPDIDGMVRDIEKGDLEGMASRMGNVFEPGITALHPVIAEIRTLMEENGALKAMMSGSGPTVFGLFRDKRRAEKAARRLRASRLCRVTYLAGVFRPMRDVERGAGRGEEASE